METGAESETESRGETDSAMEATSKLKEIKYYSSRRPICKLSDPAQPHTLFRVYAGQRSSSECFSCKEPISRDFEYSYHCFACRFGFPQCLSPLPPRDQAPFSSPTSSHYPQTRPDFRLHVGCQVSYTKASRFDSEPDLSVMKCKCCQRNLGDTYYACSICAFTLHLSCSKISPLTIQRPMSTPSPSYLEKTHPHVMLVECHCVGRVIRFMLASFVTTWCIVNASNFPVLPRSRVIRIVSLIRLLFLPWISLVDSVPKASTSIVGNTLALYSVHSKCATRKDVWDGIDLEGVPLEEEEDVPPFKRIDDQTIRHFNHEHHLRWFHGNDDDDDIREDIKFCQACVLPIISDPFYSCMQCNFVLHEACANRSLKVHHPLHVHPLNLVLMRPLSYASNCKACNQQSLGFLYKCREKYCYFKIDARCASIPEPFNHKSYRISLVECLECNSFLCLGCASLLDVAIYKHPLTLCYGEKKTQVAPIGARYVRRIGRKHVVLPMPRVLPHSSYPLCFGSRHQSEASP